MTIEATEPLMSKKKKVIELPKIKKSGARAEIRRIAKEETENLVIIDHARDRQQQRGISDRQILKVLIHGDMLAPPEWDTNIEKGWKCKLTRCTAGVMVTVVAKIVDRSDSKCLVVTVFKGANCV